MFTTALTCSLSAVYVTKTNVETNHQSVYLILLQHFPYPQLFVGMLMVLEDINLLSMFAMSGGVGMASVGASLRGHLSARNCSVVPQ